MMNVSPRSASTFFLGQLPPSVDGSRHLPDKPPPMSWVPPCSRERRKLAFISSLQ